MNPYRILGLVRSASSDDVKRAYRELAKRFHPDRSSAPEDEERFQQIVDAYQMLVDPTRRSVYDAEHTEASAVSASAAPRGVVSAVGGVVGGVGRAVRGVKREIDRRWALGQDLRYDVPLTFAEACLGGEKQVQFDAPVRCAQCGGRGERDGSPCAACVGQGVVMGERSFRLSFPAGSESGQVTRIPGGGTPGERGGPEGDLTFVLDVTPHPLLKRDGVDLSCTVVVPATTALVGGNALVPLLQGTTVVKIPADIRSGQSLLLKGRGLPQPSGVSGDLRITVEVEPPAQVPAAVRRLLEEAERTDPDGVFPRSARYRRMVASEGEG